jgi:predicted PurR-regulated permease PerM
MESNLPIQRRAFVWSLLGLIVLSLYVIMPFLNSVLISIVLVVLFYPLHLKFLKWTKNRQGLSATFSVLAVVFLLMIPIGVLLTLISAQVASLVQKFPKTLHSENLTGLLAQYQSYLELLVQKLEKFIGTKFNLMGLAWQGVQKLGQALAQYSPSVIAGTAQFFLDLFIMLILMFYLFRDGNKLFKLVLKISPVKDQYEIKLADEMKQTIYGIFYGSFLTSLIQAILATIGYAIARIPGALVWGLITFFVSFIPIIGTGAVLIPMVTYLFIKGETGYAIFLAIYGIAAIGSVDNFLRPFLIRSNMHQALLFLSLFGGMAVFGPIGILLGPLVMALLTGMIRIYQEDYLTLAKET